MFIKNILYDLFYNNKISNGDYGLGNSFCNLWLQNSTPSDWGSFFCPDLFKRWALELKKSISLKEKISWNMTGKAVILISENEQSAVDLLARVAIDSGMKFFRVPSNEVSKLSPGIRAHFAIDSPSLVMLEAGEWLSSTKEFLSHSPFNDDSSLFAKSLRVDMFDFDLAKPVVLVTVVRSENYVCDELKRVGAFDRILIMERPTPDFVGNDFISKVGHEFLDEDTCLMFKKIGLLLQSEFSEVHQQNLLALRVQRLSLTESRKLNFNDLANLAIRGLCEYSYKNHISSEKASCRKTALHEAGHASIAIISSNGENIPDYATIVPSKNFEGVVFESLSYYDKMEEFTYSNMLIRTRVALAGRAAEELFFGSAFVSSGANSDLLSATNLCFHLFAYSGFHPNMSSQDGSSSNLAVLSRREEVDSLQYERISRDVRNFLKEQYKIVLETLQEHRLFVEAIADRLLWDPIVDQSEMIDLAVKHGINISGFKN